MHPVEFPEMTAKLTAAGCGALPVAHLGDKILSCWELSDEDRQRIADSGRIWLCLYLPFHPPVSLQTDCPFVDQTEWPESVSIGIPSSGDPDKDQETLERFARNDELIRSGKCPNGCGYLIAGHLPDSRECPRCGFSHTVVR
jgi:hypothetical protein